MDENTAIETVKELKEANVAIEVQPAPAVQEPKNRITLKNSKIVTCQTQDVKAIFELPSEASHAPAKLTISGIGNNRGKVHLNGKAAKSLYLMLQKAFK